MAGYDMTQVAYDAGDLVGDGAMGGDISAAAGSASGSATVGPAPGDDGNSILKSMGGPMVAPIENLGGVGGLISSGASAVGSLFGNLGGGLYQNPLLNAI